MNTKEINEIRRRWVPDKNAVGHIYGCYVSPTREVIADIDEPLSLMNEDEKEKYLGFLKKCLSGTLGKNLIDIVFSTQQVMEGEEHKMLMVLRETKLENGELRRSFYQQVIDHLDMDGVGYLLLMAFDTYDVPHKGKDGSFSSDEGDQVFNYFMCAICPVKENKPFLTYFPGDNEFHFAGGTSVQAPDLGFLFPAFDDRATNIYNVLYYTRKPGDLHQDFIDAIFHVDAPMSSEEQKEAFQSCLLEALNDECSLDVVQAVHEQLTTRINEHKDSKSPEPLKMTSSQIGAILRDCQVPEECIEVFEEKCSEQFGESATLTPANLINPGKFVVQTEQATVAVDPAHSFMVETRVIDGRPYILIPADADVEVNGMSVKVVVQDSETLSQMSDNF